MPKKDSDQYDLCIDSIVQQTDKKSEEIIDRRTRNSNIALKKLYAANFEQEKIDALNHLIIFFANGFYNIAERNNLKNHNYLPIFTSDYTAAFDSGIDEQFDEVQFDYQTNRKRKPILQIRSLGMSFDLFIESYEFALKSNQITPPKEYDIYIYTDQFVEEGEEEFGTKEILLELLL